MWCQLLFQSIANRPSDFKVTWLSLQFCISSLRRQYLIALLPIKRRCPRAWNEQFNFTFWNMLQYCIYGRFILYASNDFHLPTTMPTGLKIDFEYSFQPLCPGHLLANRLMLMLTGIIGGWWWRITLASFRGRDQTSILCVRCIKTMKSCEVNSRRWDKAG